MQYVQMWDVKCEDVTFQLPFLEEPYAQALSAKKDTEQHAHLQQTKSQRPPPS